MIVKYSHCFQFTRKRLHFIKGLITYITASFWILASCKKSLSLFSDNNLKLLSSSYINTSIVSAVLHSSGNQPPNSNDPIVFRITTWKLNCNYLFLLGPWPFDLLVPGGLICLELVFLALVGLRLGACTAGAFAGLYRCLILATRDLILLAVSLSGVLTSFANERFFFLTIDL